MKSRKRSLSSSGSLLTTFPARRTSWLYKFSREREFSRKGSSIRAGRGEERTYVGGGGVEPIFGFNLVLTFRRFRRVR